MTQPDYIIDALQRAGGGQWLPQDLQSRKQTLRKAQIEISRQLERLTEAYLISIIPLAEYQRRRSELEQKGHALEAQTKELAAQVDRRAELVGLGSSIEDFCRRIASGLANATFDQKRAMVELLIDRVLVVDGEVEIRYVVPTHPNSENVRFCHLRKDYFHDVVQVLAGPYLHRIGPAEVELVPHTHASQCGMTGLEAIEGNAARLAVTFQCATEKDAGGRQVAAAAQVRGDSPSTLIHSAIQVHPAAPYF
jgi:hypothetical protein